MGSLFFEKNMKKCLTIYTEWYIIIYRKGGDKVSKKKHKKNDKQSPVEKVLLVTAILEMVKTIIEIVNDIK